MLDGFAVHLDLFDALGMDIGADLLAHRLAHDEEAGHLDAAAGGAGTGADEHQQHQHQLGRSGPQIKVAGGETGGGDDGGHLEKGLDQGIKHIFAHIQNADENHRCRAQDDGQIGAHLFHGKGILHVFQQDEIIGVEIDAEKDHKDGDDPLTIHRITGNTVVLDAKTAGARRAKAEGHGVKQRHAACQKQNDLDHRHHHINNIQDSGGVAQTGHQLAHGGAGALCPHEVHVAAAVHGHHRQHEHQNAHAADPMGEGSPEQADMAERLHIGQDGSAGGGESRDRFKKGIGEAVDLSGEHKRQTADGTHQDPAEGGADTAFLEIKHGVFRLFPPEHQTHQQRTHTDDEIDLGFRLPVQIAHDGTGGHQKAFHRKHVAQDITDHG